MLEQFSKNMEYYYEENKLHKLLAFIPNEKIVLITIVSLNPPVTMEKEEQEKILSRILKEVKWNTEESLQGIVSEYYYDWEKDKESGAIKGSLFDYPGFDGIAALEPLNPLTLTRMNDFLRKVNYELVH